MSKRVYFKIVSIEDRLSYVKHPFAVQYREKKWTKPRVKNSSLMVFSERKFAEMCIFAGSKIYKIVKCHIKRSKRQPKKGLTLDKLQLKCLRKYWKMVQENHRDIRNRVPQLPRSKFGNFEMKFPPRGTVFADKVFCLE